MKSKKVLSSFIIYCYKHPDERFWQALRNWAKVNSICVQNGIETLDTFYFEGKDK